MVRLGRYFLPDQPLHVIQRGNNRGTILFTVEDYTRYHAGRGGETIWLSHLCLCPAGIDDETLRVVKVNVTPGPRLTFPECRAHSQNVCVVY